MLGYFSCMNQYTAKCIAIIKIRIKRGEENPIKIKIGIKIGKIIKKIIKIKTDATKELTNALKAKI